MNAADPFQVQVAQLCEQVRELLHDRYRDRGHDLLAAIEGICNQEAEEMETSISLWLDDQRALDECEERHAG